MALVISMSFFASVWHDTQLLSSALSAEEKYQEKNVKDAIKNKRNTGLQLLLFAIRK